MTNKIDWNDKPKPVAPGSHLELLRCGIGRMQTLVAICPRHISVDLHFWHRRSFPHTVPVCEACDAGNVASEKGYMGVWLPKSRTIAIVEFTPRCYSALDAYFLAHGSCRGGQIQITREGKRDNGKLILEITASPYGQDQIPPPLDCKVALATMWGSPNKTAHVKTNPGRPVVEAAANAKEVAAARFAAGFNAQDLTGTDATMSIGNVAALLAAHHHNGHAQPTTKGAHE